MIAKVLHFYKSMSGSIPTFDDRKLEKFAFGKNLNCHIFRENIQLSKENSLRCLTFCGGLFCFLDPNLEAGSGFASTTLVYNVLYPNVTYGIFTRGTVQYIAGTEAMAYCTTPAGWDVYRHSSD
jgi:hypothetical protein